MTKRNEIIYWITIGFLAFGMLAQGVTQITHSKGYVNIISHLGYPVYLLTILGIWKILAVAAVLIPKFKLLKEWAYAGFFFVMSGAIFSHVATGDSIKDIFPSLFLLILAVASWYFRPADKKIILTNQ